MYRPRLIPVLLLKGKGLVKTKKFSSPRYIGDPINAVKIFNDREADELIFLDITATKENRTTPIEVIKKISEESFMPFSIGGGISNIDQIREFLKNGAEKICLNSILYKNPNLINEASQKFGNQSIVAVMDVKKNIFGKRKLYSHSGTKVQKMTPLEFAKEMSSRGAGEIMINSIDRDGMMDGYDLELIQKISLAIDVPLIVCGGAFEFHHLQEAVKAGASACAAGSMIVFHGRKKAVLINYPDNMELRGIFK